jgi:phosphatidylinositol alpha-1,6-mannosyltransferase
MKILIITWNFPPKTGGIENVMYNIWDQLRKRNDVFVIAPHANSENSEEPDIFRPKFPQLLWFMLFSIFKGAQVVVREKPDVLFAGSALMCPATVVLARLFRRRVVTQIYGLDVIYRNILYQLMVRCVLRRNDRVIAISEMSRNEAVARGTPPNKTVIIHPGTNTETFYMDEDKDEIKRKHGLDGRKVILSVCRMAKRKGIAEFARNSLPDIVRTVPEAVYLVVGENPSESLTHKDNVMQDIRSAIEETELHKHVLLLGRVEFDTLIEIYNLSDVFVLPVIPIAGDVEGFGVVFIEANAAGIPCVATKTGGIPDAIENGRSGILVEPNDYRTLTDKIVLLLEDSELRKDMGEYGCQRARRSFDWNVIGVQHEDLLERILR